MDEDGEPEVDESTVGVGSIAAGRRYDNLVQLFTAASAGDLKAGKKASGLPCVEVSIGFDRVFALTWGLHAVAEVRKLLRSCWQLGRDCWWSE